MPDEIKQDREWGKLSKGQPYNLIARDLDRAFAATGKHLSGDRLVILVTVREQSWAKAIRGRPKSSNAGWPDPLPVRLRYRELSRETGIPYQSLHRAAQWLIAAKVLIPTENPGEVLINKNADEWIVPETSKPLISQRLRDWAKSSRTASHKRHPVSANDDAAVSANDDAGRRNDVPSAHALTPRKRTRLHPVSANDDAPSAHALTPHIERPRDARAPSEKPLETNPPNPLRGDRTAPQRVGEDPDPDRNAAPAAKAEPEFPPRPTDRAAYFRSIFGEEAGKRLKGGGNAGR